eukprot:jgi/Ulvmu1/6229/UM028_0087.1
MAARDPSARSEASARSSPSGHRLLMDYFAQVSKYLVVEVSICVCVSMLCSNIGSPPWRLKADSWHDTVSRVSLWLSVCHGTASLANGAFSKDFQTIKWKIAWLTCFLLSCTSQAVAVAVPAVPPLARLVVGGVANTALIMVHNLPQVSEGWDTAFLCFRFQVEDRALWVSHALLLIETTNQVEESVPLRRLAVIVLAQAIWQVIAWVDALQSAPYHRYALVTTAMQLSHIVSIHMTWQAQALGVGHAAIVVYLFFAASSALYEPRVNLPNFAANKTMDVWYAVYSALHTFWVTSTDLRWVAKLPPAQAAQLPRGRYVLYDAGAE